MKITFPSGIYYVANQKQIIDTLFTPGGTASGYYKKYKRRVQFFNPQGIPVFALINNRSIRPSESPFFVSTCRNNAGQTVYFHSLSGREESTLGLQSFRQSMEFAESAWQLLRPESLPV